MPRAGAGELAPTHFGSYHDSYHVDQTRKALPDGQKSGGAIAKGVSV
jgi:hypothetical protein